MIWLPSNGAVAIWDMNDGNILSSSALGAVPSNYSVAGIGDFFDTDPAVTAVPKSTMR